MPQNREVLEGNARSLADAILRTPPEVSGIVILADREAGLIAVKCTRMDVELRNKILRAVMANVGEQTIIQGRVS